MQRRLTERLVRRFPIPPDNPDAAEELLLREWLVTNGLGGYASSTLGGIPTRRYHGLLVAALPNPLGRQVMLNRVIEYAWLPDGPPFRLDADEAPPPDRPFARSPLREFRIEAGLPVWDFALPHAQLQRRVVMPHRQNTVILHWRHVAGDSPVILDLRPAVHFRGYEDPVSEPLQEGYHVELVAGELRIVLPGILPPLKLAALGSGLTFLSEEPYITQVQYRMEARRGYDSLGVLWSPGSFRAQLTPGAVLAVVASTEPAEVMMALPPDSVIGAELERRRRLLVAAPSPVRASPAGDLVLAADEFIITPAGRLADAARAAAIGDEIRTIIAGYHWFTDWGRDTMISLEGLTLVTGRHREAASILRTFAHYMRDGLIPNMFPDGSNEGLYHTADATLWFFHAIDRYLTYTNNRALLGALLPALVASYEHHVEGTHYGIGVDPTDDLLRQGAEGYPLTWMDAKVGDWVVTPRRGKAVEVNALWHNALRLLARWLRLERGQRAAREVEQRADRVRASFNARFWNEELGYLNDVIDGPDGASTECRPNQLLAISLPHPVLDPARWPRVVDVVRERLLTPYGLRSLAPGSANYKPRYYGDLRTRDAAYHQGTVWGWLIGPWVDAWIRVYPEDRVGARRFLLGLVDHLDHFGVNAIAEIFDAEPPYTPRGCVAQAWSLAETLRCWVKTAE